MGLLVDGVWRDDSFDKTRRRGAASTGRPPNSATGSRRTAAPDRPASGGFPAEPGRYHLYVSLACPWAHRTLIFRKLKGLEGVISMSVPRWLMGEQGWTFGARRGRDRRHASTARRRLHEIYLLADPRYTGRVTVPVLWDKKRRTIVNNEFVRDHPDAQLGVRRVDRRAHRLLSAGAARARSTRSTTRVYPNVNNGVYRAGFRHHAGGLRGGVPRRVRRARRAGGAAVAPALSGRRPHDRGRLAAVHRRWSASTRSITATSNATCAASPTIRTCRTICATSTRCRASPRP